MNSNCSNDISSLRTQPDCDCDYKPIQRWRIWFDPQDEEEVKTRLYQFGINMSQEISKMASEGLIKITYD